VTIETEAKFAIDQEALADVRYRLIARGARQVSRPLVEENWLFDFPDQRLRHSGCLIRIRSYGSRTLLTFKGPVRSDPKLKKREEIQTVAEDGDALRLIVERLGLTVWFHYRKTREIFELSHELSSLEVCLDVTAVGTFVELEGNPEIIHQVAAEFGWTNYIKKSYVELFQERGH
jgi:predicted adenylyl cyclase CyaB